MAVGDGTPGPGRPKGVQNKLTRTVKEAFGQAFEKLQDDPDCNLETWGRANPKEFYQLASKLIPTEVDATVRGNLFDVLAGLGSSTAGKTDNPPMA